MTASASVLVDKKSQRNKMLLKQQLIELLRDDVELRALLQLETVQNGAIMQKKTKEERSLMIKKSALKRGTVEKLQALFKDEPEFETISK